MSIVTANRTERVAHIALIAVGVVAVLTGFSWITLLICCVLFSSAIFTGIYRFLLWPVGLMLSLLFLYGSFVVASKFGASGISTRWGQVSLLYQQNYLFTLSRLYYAGFETTDCCRVSDQFSALLFLSLESN